LLSAEVVLNELQGELAANELPGVLAEDQDRAQLAVGVSFEVASIEPMRVVVLLNKARQLAAEGGLFLQDLREGVLVDQPCKAASAQTLFLVGV